MVVNFFFFVFFCIWSIIIFLNTIVFSLRLFLQILLLLLKPRSTLACPWLMTWTSLKSDFNSFGIFRVDFWKNKSSNLDSLLSKALSFLKWAWFKVVKGSEYYGNAFSDRLKEIAFNKIRWVNSFLILLRRWSGVEKTIKSGSKKSAVLTKQ